MAPNYEAIREKAYRYARLAGFSSQQAKDIAQDVVEWYLTHPDKANRRKVNHVTIDVIRSIYGDPRHKTKRPRPVSLETIDRVPAPDIARELVDECLEHTRPGLERAAFVLVYKWGMTHKEIADAVGVKVSDVSRSLAVAISDVERAIRRDNIKDSGNKS